LVGIITKNPSLQENIPDAIENLKARDPILKKIIEVVGPFNLKLEKNAFHMLASSIVSQQLSVHAAGAIFNRLMMLNDHSPVLQPQRILDLPIIKLRKCGISEPKCRFLKDLAQKFVEKIVIPGKFKKMSNDEIIEKLTEIKGIGRWTAEMFLIFSLGRLDILPLGDVGFQRAIKIKYRLRSPITPKKIQKLAKNWEPYCSIAAWYLWHSLKNKK
jgi:DNA-3-methyladenine glycosylase II